MSPTRSRYKELRLEVLDPLKDRPRQPRQPPMPEEKRDERAGDPIQLLLKESLTTEGEMMEIFAQILRRLPTIANQSSSSGHFGGVALFKVQVNFDIPVFECQIDANALERWLNMLEGYFFVHNFSDGEKITFALLKVVPHVKIWWETYYEQNSTKEPRMFEAEPTWDSFTNVVKEQYYPVGNYDNQYTRWTTLRQERDQTMSEFTNTFHTLHTKIGIKDFEQHLVLKYCGGLHRYIQTEMECLDISSLRAAYRYDVKIEQNLSSKISGSLGLQIHNNKSFVKIALTHRTPNLKTTSPSHRQRRVTGRQRTLESGVSSTKAPCTTLMNVARNCH
jgi:hypothetical protein